MKKPGTVWENFRMAGMDRFGPLVTSQQNARVKAARSLAQKKFRQKEKAFVAEGEAFLRMGLKSGFKVREVFVLADAVGSLDDLMHGGSLRARDIVLTSEPVQAALAGRDNPQSVITVFEQKALTLAEIELLEGTLWVALQDPRDPGNLGTVIRTADAAGANGVIILGGGCDPYSPEAVRASMGSIFAVPVVRTDLQSLIGWRMMAETPGQMVGLALEGSTLYTDADYAAPLILMAGNEQTGLPEKYRAACDSLVHIPMAGEAESLNLAVSTAIVLYHAAHALHRFAGERATPSTLDFKPGL